MATDPLKPKLNRANQLKTDPSMEKGIRLYDIDLAIATHMEDTVVPSVEEFGEKLSIPVLYGNPERWKAVRKDGVLRDQQGQVQIPLIMFKRNSIARNDAIGNMMNRHVSYPTFAKYSRKHKYDRFSRMTRTKRPVEQYNVTIPDYVTLTYEVMIWTDFIEHMNQVVEAFQYATDEYWGDKDGFKFKTEIDSFDNTTEVGEGSERIVRTTFTLVVNAYLLPAYYDNEPTTKKSISPKKVVWGYETDLTGDKSVLLGDQVLFSEYSGVTDFLNTRNSEEGVFIDANTFKLTNKSIVEIPSELQGNYTQALFSIYIDGLFIEPDHYIYYQSGDDIIFEFTTDDFVYVFYEDDVINITGKFK